MHTMHIAMACRNASGHGRYAGLHHHRYRREYGLGIHHNEAEAMGEDADYEEPDIQFC
ncbi:hypothetical protein [Ralstonia pseudosolanacearum]|uniref:hypothetical protein n=1 Tax=Ralstonia pseudosolanacearum TaxID=1310165 RepID=UPI004054918C